MTWGDVTLFGFAESYQDVTTCPYRVFPRFTLAMRKPRTRKTPRQLFVQLIKSIQSGDLAGAQKAYASLTQAQSDTASDPNDPFSQAMQQIGASLQSENIGGAQQALSTLQHELEGKHQAHHHHRSGGSLPPAPTTVAPADGTDPNGTVVVVVA
jgi:hypothetical protein